MGDKRIVTIALIIMLFGVLLPINGESNHSRETGMTLIEQNEIDINESIKTGYFIENKGQWDDDVLFVTQTDFGKVGLGSQKLMFNIHEVSNVHSGENQLHVVEFEFMDSELQSLAGMNELVLKNNYFFGNDPSKWITGARTFQSVVYNNIWDGIDLKYYFNEEGLKYDFILEPFADPEDIQIKTSHPDTMNVFKNKLEISVTDQIVVGDRDLYTYYKNSNEKIDSQFIRTTHDTFSFSLPEYDNSKPVIIDPLLFSTYVGGFDDDYPYCIEYDTEGNIYVGGDTRSGDFYTTPDAHQDFLKGFTDAYIFKLNNDGSQLLYSSLIGGTSWETVTDIAIDENGDVYLGGETSSNTFPTTTGAYDEDVGGFRDAFVMKFDSNFSDLKVSTVIGGDESEYECEIELSERNVYMITQTYSDDYPISDGAYDTVFGGGQFEYDLGITVLNKNLTEMIYSTYYGGGEDEEVHDMILDDYENVYFLGHSNSDDLDTTPGAYKETLNAGTAYDGYIAKLNSNLSKLEFSTFFGGTSTEYLMSINLDQSNFIYVFGQTYSTDFPLVGDPIDDTILGGSDCIIAKFNQNCSTLLSSTYFGGSFGETAIGMRLDLTGNLVVMMRTYSTDMPTTSDAHQQEYSEGSGWGDFYIAQITNDMSSIMHATYFGGPGTEYYGAYALNPLGYLYFAGSTSSNNLSSSENVYGSENFGENDTIVMKYQFMSMSEPDEVYSLNIYSDSIFSDPVSTVDIGDKVYLELRGLDSNNTRKDYAQVNISFRTSDINGLFIPLFETGNSTGIYRSMLIIPSNTNYFDTLIFESRKDPTKTASLVIDKPDRPSSVTAIDVFMDNGFSKFAPIAVKNETIYLQVRGVDTNPFSKNHAFINITSDHTITQEELLILEETDDNTGIYKGSFKIPGNMIFFENVSITSKRTPSVYHQLQVNEYVLIGPLNDVIVAHEDQHYSVYYENLGWSQTITWSFEADSTWIDWDESSTTLYGLPDNNDVGRTGVWITVIDDLGNEEIHEFKITVKNRIPTVNVTLISEIGQEEDFYLDFNSDDEGVGTSSWHLGTQAEWLSIDKYTGELSGTPGYDHIGLYDVRVWIDDGNKGKNITDFNITVLDKNDPPQIITTDIKTVTQGEPYRRDYDVSDLDSNDIHVWELNTDAKWLTLNENSGLLTGSPGPLDVGVFFVNVTVRDVGSLFDSHNFTLTVENLNDKPYFIDLPEDIEVLSGNHYFFNVNATDYDTDDTLEYSISSLPQSDIEIDRQTGEINWDASLTWFDDDEEVFDLNVEIVVTDGEFSIKYNYKIFVKATQPPVSGLLFPADGVKSSYQNSVLRWEGADPEGEDLTYDVYIGTTKVYVSSLQQDTIYISDYEETSLVVTGLDPGVTYYWTVIPYDGGSYGTCTSGVYSFRLNSVPEIDSVEFQYAQTGDTFRLLLMGSDSDSDDQSNLKYSLESGPAGIFIDESSGLIRWSPKSSDIGLHQVVVNLTDGIDTVKSSFTIEVQKGHESSSIPVYIMMGAPALVILLIIIILMVILIRRKSKESSTDTNDSDVVEEQVIGTVDEEKPPEFHSDVALSPAEAHAHLGHGSKEVSYEDLYGMKAPEIEKQPDMTTTQLRDDIRKQISDLEKMEE